jgi:transposase-like protein
MGLSKEFKVYKTYSEELKKQAVFKVLSGAMRKGEALREYGICSPTSLDRWLERYGHGILSEHKELLQNMGTRRKKEAVKGEMHELEALRRELAEANKRVHAAELRAEAYSLMIDLAEKELKVAIRKKSGTK